MPIHIYQAATGLPVAIFLRPGKTPDGSEVRCCAMSCAHPRPLAARDILFRGDSHYGRPEAMSWCERNRVGYIFGLAGNAVLLRRVAAEAEQAALDRLSLPEGDKPAATPNSAMAPEAGRPNAA